MDADSIAEYRQVIHLIIIISVERAEEDGKRNSMEVDGPRITAQPGWNPYTKRDSSEIVHWLAQVLTFTTNIINIINITRPKPAYGRQNLAGSWGQDTDEVSTFLVFSTSHFAPAALSSDLNQPVTINDNKNPPGIMKTRTGAINNMKNHLEP